MTTPLPGAIGLFPYRKIEWDLHEAITVLSVALARKNGTTGLFSQPFDREKFEGLTRLLGQDVHVNSISRTWYYDGRSASAREATELLSSALEAGDLRRRGNYKYATVELMRWARSLDLDLSEVLPEFGLPSQEVVDQHFEAEAALKAAKLANYREQQQQKEARVGDTNNHFHGSVQAVNQGNQNVTQTFHNGQAAPDLAAVLAALRDLAQDPAVPEKDKPTLEVIAENVEKNADKPALQGTWLEAAKGTLETLEKVPGAVTTAKLVAAYVGTMLA